MKLHQILLRKTYFVEKDNRGLFSVPAEHVLMCTNQCLKRDA